MGEPNTSLRARKSDGITVDTFSGRIHVEWDPTAAVTPLGQMVFFIDFLKTGGLYEPWVADCPLHYTSPNAPKKPDVLGTVLLSVLAGHHRYSHITNVRCDNVNPGLLGMMAVVSEDSVRKALRRMDKIQGAHWLKEHMRRCYEALLAVPWIMDGDTTIKPLYGKLQPTQAWQTPSHTYHSYLMANTRLVLDVEVQAGNKTATCYSTPGLMEEELQLMGWKKKRRVIVLRRALKGDVAISAKRKGQMEFGFVEIDGTAKKYEYAVLATTLKDEVLTIAQHYRDRADAENNFDELKNQWGWGGYTTKDLKRCGFMARIVALIYNWWSLFVRLARPDKHLEAITSAHAKTEKIQRALNHIATFLRQLRETAEQLTQADRWRLILSRAFVKLLGGRSLRAPDLLPQRV